MVLDPTYSFESARIVDAGVIAVLLSEVTGLMQGAVVVCCADGLRRLFGQAVSSVRVTMGQFGALTLIGAWQIDAARSLGARWWCQLCALINVSADTIGQEPVAARTHAKSCLPASVDTLFIGRARVGG